MKKKYVRGVPGNVLYAEYFYYETQPDCKEDLAIVWGGYEKCAADFEIKRSSYPYYVIKYTINGIGVFTVNSRSYHLKSGTVSGFSPGAAHHYKCHPDNPMEHIFVVFTGSKAKQLFRKSTLASKGMLYVSSPDKIFSLMQSILQNGLEKSEYSHELCCSYLRTLMLEIASDAAQSSTYHSLSMTTYQKCKKYIDENFSTITSPRQTARACGINVRYMARLFRQYGQISPHKYTMRLKMNKAGTLLLTTDFKIKQIGQILGFEDPYHFSRNFKKHYCLSPRQYKNTHL